MNNSKIKVKEYEAFEKEINIKLFNDIVSLIMETTNVDYNSTLNELKQKHIWFQRTINNTIQEEYGFKYFGELLERYEQRIGTNIKDIRAIALALAYSKSLITKEMITGTQLVDFINKVKRMSEKDIYLKGALYLYDQNKYYNLFEEIIHQELNKTEDVVFAISLFNDINNGFQVLQEQLESLIGKNRTISVMENAGIYNWIIKNLYSVIKSNRKKGIELIKTIVKIPTGLIKEDSKVYNILIDNKYTKEEIAFLNYRLIYYQSIPNIVKIGNSIVEEKIAINFCKKILNSENTYTDDVYELIMTMLDEYRRFQIKYLGYKGLKEAIVNSIDIKNPKVFIKFYEILDYHIYSFDILNEEWNIVQQKFDSNTYRYLFDNYLQSNDYTKEQLKERINKYDELSNMPYIDSFNIYDWHREGIYLKLVTKEIIDLQLYFEKYRDYKKNKDPKENKMDFEHTRSFIHGINNKQAFLFLRYLLNLKEYSIGKVNDFGFRLDELFTNRHGYSSYYYSSELNIKRKFLSPEENKELLMCLEEYIFNVKPDDYIGFVSALLDNNFVDEVFTKEELRKLYFASIEIDDESSDNKRLREKYLSKKELAIIEKEEREAEEKEKLMKKLEKENNLIEEFKAIENKTFESIYKFGDKYSWWHEEKEVCCRIIIEYLNENIQNHKFVSEELIYFNKICNLLLKSETINIEKAKEFIIQYIERGE